jgi:hypothetical protein
MRDEIWELLILADANARYYALLLERRTRIVQWLSIGAAIVASGSVVMSVAKLYPVAVPIVSAVGATCAVISTHLKTPEPLTRSAIEWRQIERAASAAWFQLERGELVSEAVASDLRTRFASACALYPDSKTDQSLFDSLCRQALAYRGVGS